MYLEGDKRSALSSMRSALCSMYNAPTASMGNGNRITLKQSYSASS